MIAQTSAVRCVSRCRLHSFPQLETVADLLTCKAFVLFTPVRRGGCYCLFYAVYEGGFDADFNLHIALSSELTVSCALHSDDRVKISARSAHPAGSSLNGSGEPVRWPRTSTERAEEESYLIVSSGSCRDHSRRRSEGVFGV
jgi:hypothetical protein